MYAGILGHTSRQTPIPGKNRTFHRLFTITRHGEIRLSLGMNLEIHLLLLL